MASDSGQPAPRGPRPPGDGWRVYDGNSPQRRTAVGSSPLETSFTGDDSRYSGGDRRRPGRRRVKGYALVAALAFILGLGTGYARGYFSTGTVGGTVKVVVPVGATLSSIAAELEAKGVVKHARAFVIRAESDGYATKFKPGTYTFRQNEPYERLVDLLTRGVNAPTVKVSIPEGTTLRQAAVRVAAVVPSIPAAAYIEVARDEPPPFKLEGYKKGTTLEGLLFPATYEVLPKITAPEFVDEQLATFDRYFAEVDLTRATKANLTAYDVVIIASMIDREAQMPGERRLVAAVIWNRLREDMMLQIDATVQYALGQTKPVLTFDDLKIDSPYNTYEHRGLPPTPISNPGLAALKAAADPADVPFLYYVARNDGSGRHYFSTGYDQFLADQAKARANGQ